MTLARKIKRNKVSIGFAVAIAGCFALNSGEIQKNMATVGEARKIAQMNAAKDMELRLSQQQAQMQSEIAIERYQAGCVLVVTKEDPNTFTSLSEGQPVIDSKRETPLPAGTIVCDANGNTGKIVKSDRGEEVVGEMAFTGNAQIVSSARQRASQVRYVLPTNQ